MSEKKVSRRQFIKYGAAAAAGIAVGGLATYAAMPAITSRPPSENQATEIIWSSYGGVVKEAEKSLLEGFQTANKCTVNFIEQGDPSIYVPQLAATKAAGTPPAFDVAGMDRAWAYSAVPQGLVLPLDYENIPNAMDLIETAKPAFAGYGPGRYIAVPAMCYNTQKVQELGIAAPDSWEDLFDPVWKGKIVVQTPENPEAHTQLIKFQEIGGGDVTDASMTQGLKLWKENFMPNEPTFVPGATAQVNAFTNGTAWIGIVPSGRIFRMKQSGLPVEFVLPKENSLAMFDDLQVAFGTSAKKLAEKWINFLIGPEMQKAFANSVHYGVVNKKVTLTDEEKKYTLTPDQLQKIPAFPDTFVSTNREAWTTALEKIIAGG